jgi:transposase
MSRKLKKRAAKRQAPPTNTKALISKFEKDLLSTPSQLVAQLNKEINKLKQKELQIRKALVKLSTVINKSEKQAANKLKPSGQSQKKLKQAKKAQTALQQEAKQTTQLLKTTQEQRKKLLALSKYIAQFKTVWTNASKQVSKKRQISKERKQPKPNPLISGLTELSNTAEAPSVEEGYGQIDEQSEMAS